MESGVMKKLKYIEFTGSACLDTGLYCDRYTEVEARFIPVATTYTYWDCFFGAQNWDDAPDTFQLRRYDRGQNWMPRIQNYQPSGTGFPSIVNGQEYHVILNEEMLMVNDVELCPMSPTTNTRTTNTLYMGATHTGTQIYRPYNSKWIEFIVREGGVEVGHFVPVLDDNDEPAFYDSISGNYFYKTGTGTWTAGPIATTLQIDPVELAFDSTGGSQTISVTSNTAWHVDTNDVPSWLTLSPLSGVDGDTITATTSWIMSSNVPDRSASITITNEEDVAELSISQKGTGTLFFPDKIMYNDNGVWKTYYVARNVMKMYYNDNEVFRRVSFTPSLSLSTNSLSFKKTGGTDTVGVSANTSWSVSTSASWVTITTASTGFSVTAADYSSGETSRQATIIVIASNGDMSVQSVVSVEQAVNHYTELAWISNDHNGNTWSAVNCLTIPIVLGQNSSFRLIYENKDGQTANNTDRLIGYTWEDTDIYGNLISDGADWRAFASSYYDCGPDRAYTNIPYSTLSDLTFGNYYIYDNANQQYYYIGNEETISTEAYLRCDLDCIKIKGLYIYDDGVEVFHGVPAMDGDGNVGLWDEVSEELIYNPDQTMTYGEIE